MLPRLLLGSLALLALQACAQPSGGAPLTLVPSLAPAPTTAAMPQAAPLAVAADDGPSPSFCARGEHVLACAAWRPELPPHLMSMAVSRGLIGVGWTTSGNPWMQGSQSQPQFWPVGFEILDQRLEPVARVSIPGEAVNGVAVAAWRSGWVVALIDGTSTIVRAIDGNGTMSGALARLDGAGAPHLSVNAHGEVLVVRTTRADPGAVVRAALLTDLAEPPLWDVVVVEQPTEARFGSVVTLDDGFLVAQRGRAGVEVVHVDRRGRLDTRHQQMGSSTEYPKLASCGGDATMTWADFSSRGEMRWARLDGQGRSVVESRTLGGIPEYFDPSPAICDRHGSVVLLGGYTGGTGVASHLELLRVDHQGRAGQLLPVIDGSPRVYDWRIDELDDDVVVAWIELESSLGVARLRKPPAGDGDGLMRAR